MDAETWRWIWLGAAVLFGLGEMATPGSFFLGPFAIGAAIAAALAFAGVDAVWQWTAFVGISVASLFALRPLARRLDRTAGSDGVGSRRLIGRTGVVLTDITEGDPGVVRIDREEWRAVAAGGTELQAGQRIRVTEVEGTKVIVASAEEIS
jgi:membrane protein implicated in regulation of membrane protease activity